MLESTKKLVGIGIEEYVFTKMDYLAIRLRTQSVSISVILKYGTIQEIAHKIISVSTIDKKIS